MAFMIYRCIVLVWILNFLHDNSVFVTMSSFKSYYFNNDDPTYNSSSSIYKGLRLAYVEHFGSVAFGSLIHCYIQLLTTVLHLFSSRERQSGISSIFKCCSTCLMSSAKGCLLQYNHRAYAYMSITGESYHTSAQKGFFLNLKHCLRVFLAKTYAEFYISIGKIFIITLNVLVFWLIAYLSLTHNGFIELIVPIMATIITTNLICCSILGMFDEVVLAILICISVDLECNDGTVVHGSYKIN